MHSYAKLNLYLRVLSRRKDGYHNIQTLFERIDLSDRLLLKPRHDSVIRIRCSDRSVPQDETNLCYKSARLLQEKCGCRKGVDIIISKRIPVGAGLGGGSSNAASALLGLNALWKLQLSLSDLASLARGIGSDVAFFVYQVPFARATLRGDKIHPLQTLQSTRFWHVLVVPRLHVSTPLIYQKWDSYSGLTSAQGNDNILLSALKKNDLSLAGPFLRNDLEPVTVRLYPEVGRIKRKLAALGLKTILMSGSGPAVFGWVSSRKEAVSVRCKLKQENRSWRVFVVRTI